MDLSAFGFKIGQSGTHSARTMMLTELSTLLDCSAPDESHEQLANYVVEFNVLNKPTAKARQLTVRHLSDLYALDPAVPAYRVFRALWDAEKVGRSLLALLLAVARDPILQMSESFILGLPVGKTITRENIELELRRVYGGRLSASSIRSYAQNINGTWTQAGYLNGRIKKVRQHPQVTPANLAEFELATRSAGHDWHLIDVTDSFPKWMASQRYRDAYFECPDDLDGYQVGEVKEFTQVLTKDVKAQLEQNAHANQVTAS